MPDNWVFETNKQYSPYRFNPYDESPGLGAEVGALFGESTTPFLARASERGAFPDSNFMDRAVNLGQQVLSTALPFIPPPTVMSDGGKMLTAAEANEYYAPKGQEYFDRPVSEGLAKVVAEQKAAQRERERVLAAYSNTHSGWTNLGLGLTVGLLDPANLAAGLIPGVGEAAVAERLGGGLLARIAGRAVGGATGGAMAMVPFEALHMGIDDDYSISNAFANIAFGAALGAGFQGLGESVFREIALRRKAAAELRGEPAPEPKPVTQDEIDGLKTELQAPLEQESAPIHAAVGQVLDERPVEVRPLTDKTAIESHIKVLDRIARENDIQIGPKTQEAIVRLAESRGIPIEAAARQALELVRGPSSPAEVVASQNAPSALNINRETFQAITENMNEVASQKQEPADGPGSKLAADSEAKLAAATTPKVGEGGGSSEGMGSPLDEAHRELQTPETVKNDPEVATAAQGYVAAKDRTNAFAQAAECLIGAGV